MRAVLAAAPAGCVGDRRRLDQAARSSTAIGDERFVGGHPLAGAEAAGVEHARGDLFDERHLVPDARSAATERRAARARCTGCSPGSARARWPSTPPTTTASMAAVSHLPHVLANVLVAQAVRALGSAASRAMPRDRPELPRRHARRRGATPPSGAGSTRANRDALRRRSSTARSARLQEARAHVAAGDVEALGAWQAPGRRGPPPRCSRPACAGGAAARAARRGAQPPRRGRRDRPDARPRRRQHRRHGARALARRHAAARSRCGSPAERAAEAARRWSPRSPWARCGRDRPRRSRPRAACAASSRRRRTSRSPTAPRCSGRCPTSRCACATTSTRPTRSRRSPRSARSARIVGAARRRGRHPRRGPARRREPDGPIDVGNAGTLMRLLPGLAGRAGRAALHARRRRLDPPAPGRPHRRAAARPWAPPSRPRDGRLPPFTVHGARLHGIHYDLPVASAQVKSCVLLAGAAGRRRPRP